MKSDRKEVQAMKNFGRGLCGLTLIGLLLGVFTSAEFSRLLPTMLMFCFVGMSLMLTSRLFSSLLKRVERLEAGQKASQRR